MLKSPGIFLYSALAQEFILAQEFTALAKTTTLEFQPRR